MGMGIVNCKEALNYSLRGFFKDIHSVMDMGDMDLSVPYDVLEPLVTQAGLKLDSRFNETKNFPSRPRVPLSRHIGRMGKSVVMSTGMTTLEEVRVAMDTLLKLGVKKDEIIILHCNTEYPTPIEDVNLQAMLTIRDELGVKVGYSDHTLGIEISVAAVAMGASVIEKHFTLDRNMLGPDHAASLDPEELKNMVDSIRKIEKAMGDGVKRPSPSGQKNISIARKSIVAKKPITKGEPFSEDNLATKRPGTGISPMEWHKVLGKIAEREYQADDLIII